MLWDISGWYCLCKYFINDLGVVTEGILINYVDDTEFGESFKYSVGIQRLK